MPYTKQDIDTHTERYYGRAYPAVCVKVRKTPSIDKIQEHFKCSEKQAEKAAGYAWEMACRIFWEDVEELAKELLGNVTAYSAGRSNGWLIVKGLPDIASWDAIQLAKWRKFEKTVLNDVEYLMSWDQWTDNIEANKWHLDGSEYFNFFNQNDQTVCIAELKQQAIEAGFGPVVAK